LRKEKLTDVFYRKTYNFPSAGDYMFLKAKPDSWN